MKLGLTWIVVCALIGCVADDDEQRREAANTAVCNNTGDTPCYCIDDSGCPAHFYCAVADSPSPPFTGICAPVPTCNAGDPNCHPTCNAGDPNCHPTCNAGDPNCPPPPPPQCNAGAPNCPPKCNSGNCH